MPAPPTRKNRWIERIRLAATHRVMILAAAVCFLNSCARIAREDLPNVLLVTLDTTRRDRLGAYGGTVPTPGFDELAKCGTLCWRAVTVSSLTWPSHCSLFTGLYPVQHGVHDNGMDRLDSSQVTLAELLGKSGYYTAASVAASVLDRRLGADQGFVRYGDLADLRERRDGRPQSDPGTWWERPGRSVNVECMEVLKTCRRPFFAWCHYFEPHSPYNPPPPFDVPYRTVPYDGEVAAMDASLRELVAETERTAGERGLLILVLADHGECLGEHNGYVGHAEVLHEEVLQIPAVFVWKNHLPAGKRFNSLFRTIDVLPTLLDLLKLEVPDNLDGVSRVSDLMAGSGGPEDCLHETCASELRRTSRRLFAYRSGDEKVLWREGDSQPMCLKATFGETEVTIPPSGNPLRQRLAQTVEAYMHRCLLWESPVKPAPPTDDLEEALRAIGYLR